MGLRLGWDDVGLWLGATVGMRLGWDDVGPAVGAWLGCWAGKLDGDPTGRGVGTRLGMELVGGLACTAAGFAVVGLGVEGDEVGAVVPSRKALTNPMLAEQSRSTT